jgi:hypothetical protein
MEFIKKINLPLMLIIAYLIKVIILVPTFVDAAILGVLVLPYLGLLGFKLYNSYLDTKKAITSENEFREAVNKDIATIKDDLSVLRMTGGQNALKTAFRR